MAATATPQRPYTTMPHPPELEAIPTAGSLVGRHLIVREIARGTVGPLFLARTQNETDAVDTLARVIPIPADLPTKDDQLIAEAIWDSANVGHDMVLRVADVVAGKGWVTLVHDHHVGSLLSTMHWRAGDLGSGFPSEIAARIALDVLEGLEQSRSLCESNRIPWRPGSIAMGSLYLCGDGRTRALDGQVMAAVMRSAKMRTLAGTSASVAPEMLDENREPDERTDVFAVGVVLWELLTGREIKVDGAAPVNNVILAVPKGTQVPQGLVYALHRALDIDPDKRQSTLRELAVELVMGAEKVATYQQVIEFAGTLMPFEMAFRASAAESPPVAQQQPQREQPSPQYVSAFAPLAPAAAQLANADLATATTDAPPTAAPADLAVAAVAITPAATAPVGSPSTLTAAALAPEPAVSLTAALEDLADGRPNTGSDNNATDAAPAMSVATHAIEAEPKGARLEQISWPDEDAAPAAPTESAKKPNGAKPLAAARDRLDDTSRSGAAGRLGTSRDPVRTDAGEQEPKVGVSPVIEIKPDPRAAKRPEPTTKLGRRDSGRPGATSKSSAASSVSTTQGLTRSSSRPVTSKPVQASAPPENGPLAEEPTARKKSGGLHITATTLILGFSTTVLAVVLIMLLLQQQKPSPIAPTAAVSATHAVPQASAPGQADAKGPGPAQADDAQTPTPRGTSASGKTADEAPPSPLDARIDRHKRPFKTGGSAAAKAFGKDDATGDNQKTTKKSGQFVPDEI